MIRYYLIPTKIGIIKRQKISSVGKDVEKWKFTIAGANAKESTYFGEQSGSSPKSYT